MGEGFSAFMFWDYFVRNLPGWVAVLFLMASAARPFLKPPRARTMGLALVVLVAMGALSAAMSGATRNRESNTWTIALLVVFYLVFRVATTLPARKRLFVFWSGMTIVAFSVLASDAVAHTLTASLPYAAFVVADVAVSLAVPLALMPLFAGRMQRALVEMDESLWKGLWLVPTTFFGVALALYVARWAVLAAEAWAFPFYVLTAALLAVLLVVAYRALFDTMRNTMENERLRAEAQVAALQASRYASLRERMRETAQARHDFRHKLLVLDALAERGDVAGLRAALAEYGEVAGGAPERGTLCANFAVDAVAAHFLERARDAGVEARCELALPERLPVAEADACMVLANLMENAVEACERLVEGAPRRMDVRMWEHGDMVLLQVENTCAEKAPGADTCGGMGAGGETTDGGEAGADASMDWAGATGGGGEAGTVASRIGAVARTDDGGIETVASAGLPSTKHEGMGVGLTSVAALARRHRGDVQIERRGGTFRARVTLRGDHLPFVAAK